MAEAVDTTDEVGLAVEDSEASSLEFKCVACDGVCQEVEYYRCSCSSGNSEESSHLELFCDVCIGPHIRQKHEVLDYKGYKPAICSTHRILSSMYCYDCDEVFCFKCVGPHCKHDYRPVSEKAKEVRKSVFEYLNHFDELAKPMARRKSFIEIFFENQLELHHNLGPNKFVNFIRKSIVRILQSNALKYINIVRRPLLDERRKRDSICRIVEKADLQIVNLRQLLSVSDSVCVSYFMRGKTDVDDSIKEQKSELSDRVVIEWAPSLDAMIEESISCLLKQWKVPGLRSLREIPASFSAITPNSSSYSIDSDVVIDIKTEETSVSFTSLETSVVSRLMRTKETLTIVKYEFDVPDVESVFKSKDIVALVCPKQLSLYNLVDKKKLKQIELDVGVEVMAFRGNWSEFEIVAWSPNALFVLQISCYPQGKHSLPCKTKPKLAELAPYKVAWIDGTGKVTVFDWMNQLEIAVFPHHHGLTNIHQLCFTGCGIVWLILFDYEAKVAVVSTCCSESKFRSFWNIQRLIKLDISGAIKCLAVSKTERKLIAVNSIGDILTTGCDAY